MHLSSQLQRIEVHSNPTIHMAVCATGNEAACCYMHHTKVRVESLSTLLTHFSQITVFIYCYIYFFLLLFFKGVTVLSSPTINSQIILKQNCSVSFCMFLCAI